MRHPTDEELQPYLDAGLQLIPLHTWDFRDQKGRQRGKTPADSDWQRKDYRNADVIARCRKENRNIGVRLDPSWVVVDCDPRNYPPGEHSLDNVELEVGIGTGHAPHTITGSGGDHYWFRKDPDVALVDSLVDYPGVEFKSRGRQVVAVGSTHPDGGRYRWDGGSPLKDAPYISAKIVALARRPQISTGPGGEAGELSCEQVTALLDQLDPAEFAEHDRWLALMMSCHHASAGEARSEFVDWSTGDTRYLADAWLIGRRWDSFSLESRHGAKQVSVKLLYKEVLDSGGEIPQPSAADSFEAVDAEELGAMSIAETKKLTPLEELNAKYAAVLEQGKFRILRADHDEQLDRPMWIRISESDFTAFLRNRSISVKGKPKKPKKGEAAEPAGNIEMPLATWWLKHRKRRQFEGVAFAPEGCRADTLNLWRGWAYEPAAGDWSMLNAMIHEVLADGNKSYADWILNWCAYMVQLPHRPAEVALVLKGEKGTGKSTLGRALTALVGVHGLAISSDRHLVGNFNAHLRDCICLFADEAVWAGNHAGESVLKQLVTEPKIMFEQKGVDPQEGRNSIHLVVASNSSWVVPAGLDGERRFGVFNVNNSWQGARDKWTELNRQLDNGGHAGFLHSLLTRDLDGWTPRATVPNTPGLMEQKLRGLDDVDSWWLKLLSEGVLPGARSDWEAGGAIVLKAAIEHSYGLHARGGLNVRRPADHVELGRRLARYAPGIVSKQVVVQAGDPSTVAVDTRGRAYAWEFPPLAACRAAWERKLGDSYTW